MTQRHIAFLIIFLVASVTILALMSPDIRQALGLHGQKKIIETAPPPTAKPAGPVPDWLQYQGYEKNPDEGLDDADRSEEAIADWSSHAVSNIMTFSYQDYRDHIKQVKDYFTRQGLENYVNYMKTAKILNTMVDQKLMLKSIVEDNICVTQSANFKGVWRWLVEVPFSMSFYSARTADVPGVSALTISRGNVKLQIRRAPARSGKDGLLIERWEIKPRGKSFNYCLN